MDATPTNPATAGHPNQDVFAETLLAAARLDPSILAVVSDSRGSGKLVPFGEALPRQIVEVGIAEQNLVGVAAGLAAAGKKVFALSPACFLTARALEQVKNDVCYSGLPVTLVGISAGLSYGALGTTHHSLHDFAVLRTFPGLTLLCPADNWETEHCTRAALQHPGPVYLRLGKKTMPNLPRHDGETFVLGAARTLREGRDALILASGETVAPALAAAATLADAGVQSCVLSVPTIKPLDTDAILARTRECRAVLTVEEHSLCGGLGEACAATLLHAGVARPFGAMGIPDEETVHGSQTEIFNHYGLSAEGISTAVLALLR